MLFSISILAVLLFALFSENPSDFIYIFTLSTDQDVLGSTPGSAVGLFSIGELFHMYGLAVFVF